MKLRIESCAPWGLALSLLIGAASAVAADEPMRRMVEIVPAPASAPQYSASYVSRIVLAIKSHIVWNEKELPDARCEVDVGLDARGNILSRRVLSSQGHPDWCPTVLRALEGAARIPADVDGRVPPRLQIAFKGRE